MECTSSFTALLCEFRGVFTQPSFPILLALMTGWVLSHRRRFVTELIWSSGSTRRGHHSRYHHFFARSVWELDTLSRVLAKLVVAVFAPTGIILLAVDDTLCRKRGLTVYGTGRPPRSLDLQPGQAPGELGARLGRRDADPSLSLLGLGQGLEPADRVSPISQPPGFDERQEDEAVPEVLPTKPRPESSHPPGTGGRVAFAGRPLQFPDRPWYRRKHEPSFADLLTRLRRASWREKIRRLPLPSRLVEKDLAPLVEFLRLAG